MNTFSHILLKFCANNTNYEVPLFLAMGKASCVAIITIVLIVFSCLTTADILPQPVPENQVFTTNSILEVTGIVSESTSLIWEIGDAGLTSLPFPYFAEDGSIKSGSIAYITYSDSITTNGGQISEVKSFILDTHAKAAGMYNIEAKKVLTYNSQHGSHLMGAESYALNIAGNWRRGTDSIVCVFSKTNTGVIPAFCNKVTASSKLTSITTAQVETVGGLTTVSEKAHVPAALNYEISVIPDGNSASGYADGIVSTAFTVSVMEGRSDGNIRVFWDWWERGDFQYWEWNNFLLSGVNFVGVENSIHFCAGASVSYNGIIYSHSELVPPSGCPTGRFQLDLKDIGGTSLPGSAGINIWSNGDGTYTMDVSVAYDGLDIGTYSINPKDGMSGIVMNGVTMPPPPIPYLDHYDELAARITAVDTASVAGGISQFVKTFTYRSGIDCANC